MINAVPCCVGYDAERVAHHVVHIAYRLVSGHCKVLCARRSNLQRKGLQDWPGPRFPASIEEKGGYHRLHRTFIYVKAAYCGANPVSHPNPPKFWCIALDPHCWASMLGRGRAAGIGADAGGGL